MQQFHQPFQPPTPPQPFTVPPGFYPDPWSENHKRRWDGTRWTQFTQDKHRTLMIWGFIAAVLLPLVGLIIGIVLLTKSRLGPGFGIIGASLLAWFVWFAIMVSSSPSMY